MSHTETSLDVEFKKGLQTYREAVDVGEADLMDRGFPPPERPQMNEQLQDLSSAPQNLGDLPIPKLLNLMGEATAWYRYAMHVLPYVTSERNAAESARDFAWSKIRRSKKGTVQDKDDETRIDARYVMANAYYETCDFKYRKIKAIADGLMRDVESISRALSGAGLTQSAEGLSYSANARGGRQGFGPQNRPAITSKFAVRKSEEPAQDEEPHKHKHKHRHHKHEDKT